MAATLGFGKAASSVPGCGARIRLQTSCPFLGSLRQDGAGSKVEQDLGRTEIW